MPQIVVFDGWDLQRFGLEAAATQAGFSVIGAFRELPNMAATKYLHPDVVLVNAEVSLSHRGGLDWSVVRHVEKRFTAATIAVVTPANSDRMIGAALNAGAQGVVDTSMSAVDVGRELWRMVDDAPGFVTSNASKATHWLPLTPREEDVLGLLVDGLTLPQIAERLGRSPATVRTHANRLYRKLDVANRSDAVMAAALIKGVA
jgi:DNA-binding NarL/FixJ family response regulator